MGEKIVGVCWKCGSKLAEDDFGRRSLCPRCGYETRVCLNCLFYAPGSHNDCREPQAERVVDKEKSTFCDYFKPKAEGGASPDASAKEALDAAEALFKK